MKPAINLKIGDIGKLTKSGYTCVKDFQGPYDYVAVIHRGTDGFLPIGHKVPKEQKPSGWDERCFHRDQLTPERLNRLAGKVDYYLGMATMFKPKRLVSNLKKLNALFADIDCRDVGLTPMQALRLFLDKYCGKKVPVPTFIICSGRGLQIIWVTLALFDRVVDGNLLIRRLNVTACNVIGESEIPVAPEAQQLDLFTDYFAQERRQAGESVQRERERRMQEATVIYSYLQAIGVIDGHGSECSYHKLAH